MRYPLACFVSSLALFAPAHAQQTSELPPAASQGDTTGFELFSGVEVQQIELNDGDEIDKVSVPLTARLTAGALRVTAQLPYVRVSGPENVVIPSGPLGLPILVDPTRPAGDRRREGIGDARLGLAYDLGIPGVNAALNAGAKVPTASVEKGLGTGEADYWAGAEVSTTMGAVTPFAGVNYTQVGDPEGYELHNTISGQAGAAFRMSRAASAHLGYSYSESASELARDEQRIFGGVNTAVGNRMSLGVYGSAGVTGAADVGAGFSLGIGFR